MPALPEIHMKSLHHISKVKVGCCMICVYWHVCRIVLFACLLAGCQVVQIVLYLLVSLAFSTYWYHIAAYMALLASVHFHPCATHRGIYFDLIPRIIHSPLYLILAQSVLCTAPACTDAPQPAPSWPDRNLSSRIEFHGQHHSVSAPRMSPQSNSRFVQSCLVIQNFQASPDLSRNQSS